MIDWLTGTLIATSLLMALVLLVREPVRRQFGPGAAYALWLIPALRMAAPPLTTTVERIVPASAPMAAAGPARLLLAPAASPGLVEQLGGWDAIAVSAWLIGAVAMLVAGALLYRWQRRQVLRDSVQLARLGNIRIVRSTAVRGPMAFGILDRVIALPIDFDDRYDPEERRLAFDHELSHHRSGDLVLSHIAFGLLCLQWFNPLAWLSHSAFRFDQEAACDARVLDKASSDNRLAYAQAITKAASGRALLFAGALDRPRTLHRRLASMLTKPSPGRRFAGNMMIAVTAAAALPLTASRATEYVDVAAPQVPAAARVAAPAAIAAPRSATAPMAIVAAAAPAAPQPRGELPMPDLGGVTLGKGDVAFMDDDTILIDSKRKTIEQLTPAERSKLRQALLRSQQDVARERAELPARLAEAQREIERARSGAMKQEYQRDLQHLRQDLARIDFEAPELRAAGEDPAKRKAEILRDLHEAEAMNIDKEIAEALRDADPAKITAELRSAEQQTARMLARLDQLDRR